MTLNFTLTPRVDPEHGPIYLQHLDEAICKYLNRDVHPSKWCCGWFDVIGFWLASGYSFDRIRRQIIEDALAYRSYSDHGYERERMLLDNLAILQLIQDNYIVNNWWGR
jgi:hypothetical protein